MADSLYSAFTKGAEQSSNLLTLTMAQLENSHYTEQANRVIVNKQWYAGNHDLFFQRFEKESAEHFNARPKVWQNLVRANIDVIVSFMYARTPRRIITPEDQIPFFEGIVNYTPQMWQNVVETAIAGYSIVQVMAFSKSTGLPINAGVPWNKDDVQIGIAVMPSEICFPSVVYPSLRPNHLSRLVLSYNEPGSGPGPTAPGVVTGNLVSKFIEITDDKWLVYKNRFRNASEEYEGGRNPYGWIPFQLFLARSGPGDEVGESLIEDIKPLNLELNNQLSDTANSSRYHGFPIYYGPPLARPGVAPDTYWEVKPGMQTPGKIEGKMEKVTLEYSDRLRQAIAECSGVPLGLLGEVQKGLGNLESELAVRLIFTRFIQLIKTLQVQFKSCEEELIKKIYKMGEYYGLVKIPDDFEVKVEFPDDILPTDRLRELQIMQIKRELGLETQHEQIRKLYPDKTEDEIQELIDELEGIVAPSDQLNTQAEQVMRGLMKDNTPLPAEMTSAKGGVPVKPETPWPTKQ